MEAEELQVEVILVDQRLNGLLAYGSMKAAGIDMRACSVTYKGITTTLTDEESFRLYPGESALIGSGVRVFIDSMFAEATTQEFFDTLSAAGLLLPRSGLGTKHRLRLANTVGLIDADYQGEVMMALENGGTEPFDIKALERLAQLVLVPVIRPTFKVVQQFSDLTKRGDGGFGSTGKH